MRVESSIKLAVALTLSLGLGFAAYTYFYSIPKSKLVKDLQKQRDANTAFESALKRRPEVRAGLKTISESTLGASRDEVDARFRDSLQRIAAACNLSGIVVNTETPDPQPNPLVRVRSLSGSAYGKLKSELRNQPDFSAIGGTVQGTGSLENVLRAMAMARQQPWVHRIQSFSIRPDDKERTRFTLKLGVTTILLHPELAPRERGEPVIVALADDAGAAWRGLVSKNIFREPPPPPAPTVATAPPKPAAPAAPPRPPYNDWKLTGVVQSRLGIEAFLVNTKNGQQLTLPTGSAVADARFVDGEGERAIFEIEGQQFEITNGQTLEQRRLLSR